MYRLPLFPLISLTNSLRDEKNSSTHFENKNSFKARGWVVSHFTTGSNAWKMVNFKQPNVWPGADFLFLTSIINS